MGLFQYGRVLACIFLAILCTCGREKPNGKALQTGDMSPILLITLDTTRADRMGYESNQGQTPFLDTMAAEGSVFLRAFATVPMTLPSHTSMMTGLYASEHGIHENARYLREDLNLLAVRLKRQGYETAAFIAAYPLASQFGMARGFDLYDQDFPAGSSERNAGEVNKSVFKYLGNLEQRQSKKPVFIWAHYFDPHAPYEPPEPFHSKFNADPYLGEVAYMDNHIGELVNRFRNLFSGSDFKILIVGDHGEGLGDHGEALHGNLLYNATMRVPLILNGPGILPSISKKPVSIRRVYHTVLSWAGIPTPDSLCAEKDETVLGEAMKPYLQYGWQPQKMVVTGAVKTLQSGDFEVFNLDEDPGEFINLFKKSGVDTIALQALESYALPEVEILSTELSQEEKEQMASLGYVSSEGLSNPNTTGPSAHQMTHLFEALDLGSGLFEQKRFAEAVPVFEDIFQQDPGNFMVCLRIAVGHSAMGQNEKAMEFFKKAMKLNPESVDLMHYLAMHFFQLENYSEAEPLFMKVLEKMPDRLPALKALAQIKEKTRDVEGAISLYEKVVSRQKDDGETHLKLAALYMLEGRSQDAVDVFLMARDLQGGQFQRNLDLGACLMDLKRFEEARECFDLVSPDHPGWAMALFKRAQISVLLGELDAQARIEDAYINGNSNTRSLIQKETLFKRFGKP